MMEITLIMGPRLSGKSEYCKRLINSRPYNVIRLDYLSIMGSMTTDNNDDFIKRIYPNMLNSILVDCCCMDKHLVLDDIPRNIEIIESIYQYTDSLSIVSIESDFRSCWKRNIKERKLLRLRPVEISRDIKEFKEFFSREVSGRKSLEGAKIIYANECEYQCV